MTLWLEKLALSAQQTKDKDLAKWGKEVASGHARAAGEYQDYLDGKTDKHALFFVEATRAAKSADDTLLAESMHIFSLAAEQKIELYELLDQFLEMSPEEQKGCIDTLEATYKRALAEADKWNAQSRDIFEETRKLVTPALGEDRFKQVATPMRQDLSSGKYFDQDYRHDFAAHVRQVCGHATKVVEEVHNNGGCSGNTYTSAREAVLPGGLLEASLHFYARQFSIRQIGLIARDIRQLIRHGREAGLMDGLVPDAKKGAPSTGAAAHRE